jgi:choice-of-anchor A domain-containing protein
MRHLAVIASLFLSFPLFADTINFGQAKKYNAFVKEDYLVNSSDVQGRVAVGGNLNVTSENSWAGYEIGNKIIDFNMGDGPSLVVGGDINKTGEGHFNIYQTATLPNPVMGNVVLGGSINGDNVDFESSQVNSTNLPVDFASSFSHLEDLSKNLSERTALNAVVHVQDNYLIFQATQNVAPDDNVYVFNVDQRQLTNQYGTNRTDWFVDVSTMADNATVVFNVTNSTSPADTVELNQSNIFFKSTDTTRIDPLSAYFNKEFSKTVPPVQVLYNFYGASQLKLNTDLYGGILAPTADIKANSSNIYGQVIGKSWEGNMQINYNPFATVGKTSTPVPEPRTFIIFAIAFLIMISRNTLAEAISKLRIKQVSGVA